MKAVALKEWRLLWASRLALVVPVLIFVAVVAAVRSGSAWSESRAAVARSYAKAENEKLAEIRRSVREKFEDYMGSAYFASHYGTTRLVLPPSPLGALARGGSDVQANVVRISQFPDQEMADSVETLNPSWSRLGGFDLAFVVVFLVPLALIAVLHDALAGDRESGRLRLALSQPVSAATLLLGSVAVRSAIVVLPLLASIVFAVASVGGPIHLLGPALAATLSYAAFWIALCAAVAGLAASPRASGLFLGVSWVALVIVVPAAVAAFAMARHPVPSRAEAAYVRNETNDRLHENWKTDDEIFRALYTDRPDLIPPTVVVTPTRIVDRSTDHDREIRVGTAISYAVLKAAEPLERAARQAARAQDQLARALGRFFPASATYDAIVDVAGNGAVRREEFDRQAKAFRSEWDDFFLRRLFLGPPLTAADYDRFPRFVWKEPPPAQPWEAVGLNLGLCAFVGALLLLRANALDRHV